MTGNLRSRTEFGPKAGPNQTQNIRHGTRKPAHHDSERFWADFAVFRRRSETFELRDSSAEPSPLPPRSGARGEEGWGGKVNLADRCRERDHNSDFSECARSGPPPRPAGPGTILSAHTKANPSFPRARRARFRPQRARLLGGSRAPGPAREVKSRM